MSQGPARCKGGPEWRCGRPARKGGRNLRPLPHATGGRGRKSLGRSLPEAGRGGMEIAAACRPGAPEPHQVKGWLGGPLWPSPQSALWASKVRGSRHAGGGERGCQMAVHAPCSHAALAGDEGVPACCGQVWQWLCSKLDRPGSTPSPLQPAHTGTQPDSCTHGWPRARAHLGPQAELTLSPPVTRLGLQSGRTVPMASTTSGKGQDVQGRARPWRGPHKACPLT